MNKRIFLTLIDGIGIGDAPDAYLYNDPGFDSLQSFYNEGKLNIPELRKLGLFNIEGVDYGRRSCVVLGAFGRICSDTKGVGLSEKLSEICCVSQDRLFSSLTHENLAELSALTGFSIGTGDDAQVKVTHTGNTDLEVSAQGLPTAAFYRICETIHAYIEDKYGVCRVVAVPEAAQASAKYFTALPEAKGIIELLRENGLKTVASGQTARVLAKELFSEYQESDSLRSGVDQMFSAVKEQFNGLCVTYLAGPRVSDTREDYIKNQSRILTYLNKRIIQFMHAMNRGDVLIITSPGGREISTTHRPTREYVPVMVYGDSIHRAVSIGTMSSLSDIGATVLDYFEIENTLRGKSILPLIKL